MINHDDRLSDTDAEAQETGHCAPPVSAPQREQANPAHLNPQQRPPVIIQGNQERDALINSRGFSRVDRPLDRSRASIREQLPKCKFRGTWLRE
jgi:hypothetical protein